MSKIGELILKKLSRDPRRSDYTNEEYNKKHLDVNIYIKNLEDTFPHFNEEVSGKNVLDIGCSHGIEAIAISILGAKEVWGIDIRIDISRASELRSSLAPKVLINFSEMDASHTSFPDEKFDVVVSVDSFEHFSDPYEVLKEIRRVTRNDGRIFITSGVWSNPWGAHMHFFTKIPWVQFIFSEKTIMNVRNLYRSDGARRFSDVEGGLNKIGVRMFKQCVKDLNLDVEYLYLRPVRGLTPLTKIPILNEFFTSLIIAVLKK